MTAEDRTLEKYALLCDREMDGAALTAMERARGWYRTKATWSGKMLEVEENMARALTLKWSDFDLAKAVSY